jgi:carbon storage regulator
MDDLDNGGNLGTLNLSRKENQRIMIGDDISIRIISIRGRHVRISVTAPKGVPVNREEVWLRLIRD